MEAGEYIKVLTKIAIQGCVCVCVSVIDAAVQAGTDIHPPMKQVTRLASEPGDLPSPLAKAAARYSA